MANYISTYKDSSPTLRWRGLLAHTVGTIELANLIGDRLGTQYGLNLGIDLHEIEDHVPEPLYPDTYRDAYRRRHAEQLGKLHPTPYQARRYRAHTAINAVQARGDLSDVLTHLFAGLLNSLGLPQLPT